MGKIFKIEIWERNKLDSVEAIAYLVKNGKNNMSAYEEGLTEMEIEVVSGYVLEEAKNDWHSEGMISKVKSFWDSFFNQDIEEKKLGWQNFFRFIVEVFIRMEGIFLDGKIFKIEIWERNKLDSVEAIAYLVKNGKNNMSAYQERLTETEIEKVSAYVLESAKNDWHSEGMMSKVKSFWDKILGVRSQESGGKNL
ncbi:hypothetical protein [Okeania sp. SIO3I5]|uniref:hypothetical protein n=1 Tax=Okeania sp. SIO3I5 TaxID=2607805 RepID=UPI0025F01F97|nr:hypothetical protein [Okeania sp. SIO3I5]